MHLIWSPVMVYMYRILKDWKTLEHVYQGNTSYSGQEWEVVYQFFPLMNIHTSHCLKYVQLSRESKILYPICIKLLHYQTIVWCTKGVESLSFCSSKKSLCSSTKFRARAQLFFALARNFCARAQSILCSSTNVAARAWSSLCSNMKYLCSSMN